MVSVYLPSDVVSQCLPSYLCFSYLGRGVSLHGCSSKAQPLLLALDEGYLLTEAPPDLEHGVAPLGPLVPTQPLLLGCGVALWTWGCSLDVGLLLGRGVAPMEKKCKKAKWLSREGLQIAVKGREVKSKGGKERYKHLNAEFQRIARRDKKAFLSDQCKEIEESNRMGKTRDLFNKN